MIAVYILSGILGAAALLFLLLVILILPSLRRHPDRALLDGRFIAHRGLHDVRITRADGSTDPRSLAPENSLAAFDLAASERYIIENDIHVTRDGEVIVFHDDDLFRMTGVHGRPEDMTLEELKQLRLGGTEQQIPTLRECLDLVDGRVPLLIEFKCTNMPTCDRLCAAAVPILDGYEGKYLVQSFFPFVLTYYRKHRPAICRGQLASGFFHDKLYMKLLGCLILNVTAKPDFVSYDHKDAAHLCRRLCTALGAHSVGWTFRSEEELEENGRWFSTFIFEGFIPHSKGDTKQ